MENSLKIGNFAINDSSPVFIIAELSANHNQDISIAIKTIEAMKKAGADAVKVQTYTPDTITIDANNSYFKINQGTIWDGTTLHKLYQKAYTPWDWQPKLQKVAKKLGMEFFSSPFDKTAVDFLEKMNVPAYKVASFEITDIPLIEYIAAKKKPVILATGISELNDIKDAVNACRRMDNNQIAILKCTSAYPAPLEEINLKTIPDIKKKFKVVAGLSDHSGGTAVPVAACALGAKIIEKHFILDRKIGGPDAEFSLDEKEFRQMVADVRSAEKALGKVTYDLTSKAKKSREHSRSLFVVSDIKRGELFTEENVRSIRPGFGLAPKYLNKVLGRKATTNLKKRNAIREKTYRNGQLLKCSTRKSEITGLIS